MRILGLANLSPDLQQLRCVAAVFLLFAAAAGVTVNAQTPAKGQTAPDFTLLTITGTPVQLSAEASKGTTVLVILRGYPDFAKKGTAVVLVYPGPPAQLDQHAKEFLSKQAALPPNITLVTDPDYKVTSLYAVRWNAPEETAYPSTFLLDKNRTVLFDKISHRHGDRTTASGVLAQISSNWAIGKEH